MEAVYDDAAKLSYHALVGTCKQSVSDVEQIFSPRVLEFFERKGYTIEAEYVLSYILDELMPWHSKPGPCDFSLLEVNQ